MKAILSYFGGTLLPHIVEDLNESDKLYRLLIYPIIKEEEDRRENKRADSTIFMIKDQITRVVIEAKLNVSDTLNYAMKNDFVGP